MDNNNSPSLNQHKIHALGTTTGLVALSLFLTACGGSSSSSDNIAFGGPGATNYVGEWTIEANINISVNGTADPISQSSTVIVNSNGIVGIKTTDTDSTLNINFNGSRINYQTSTLVSTPDVGAGAGTCVLTITGVANIVGSPSNAAASGSFSPQTTACNATAVSVTGNIVGATGSDDTTTTP